MGDRIVRQAILTSDSMASLSWPAEVFYRRLMSVADDYGRFDGRLSVLRANLYPLQLEKVSDADVGKWRSETSKAGLVSVYAVEGKEYVQIEKFGQRLQGSAKWPNRYGEFEKASPKNRTSPESTVSHGEARGRTGNPRLYGDVDGYGKAPNQEESTTNGSTVVGMRRLP